MKIASTILLFCMFFWSSLNAQSLAADTAKRFLTTVSAIRSYDIRGSFDLVEFNGSTNNPASRNLTVLNTEQIRDVLAIGFGRRIETDESIVQVIDWQTAKARKVLLATALDTKGGGSMYFDYINPKMAGAFLSDVLSAPTTTIQNLDISNPDSGLVGFEVSVPAQKAYAHVWLDPAHNYLIKEFTSFRKNEKGGNPEDRMQVLRFCTMERIGWVPEEATWESRLGAEKAWTGTHMKLLPEACTFNRIDSVHLFRPESMPPVNWEDNGWKIHYSSDLLAGIKKQEALNRQILRKGPRVGILLPWFAALFVIPGFIIWLRSKRTSEDLNSNSRP